MNVVVTTRQHIDGAGAVFFDDTGRVRIFLSDECADAFDAAAAHGITADDLVEAILSQAEAGLHIEPTRAGAPLPQGGCRSTESLGAREARIRCDHVRRPRHPQRYHKRYS